jgi:hypothetical protein
MPALINEINDYIKKIPPEDIKEFLRALNNITSQLLEKFDQLPTETSMAEDYTTIVEPRQSTPQEASRVAEKFGFTPMHFIGIHPHFSVPNLNHCFIPDVYNKISDALIPFEQHPMALLWSSVFIGVFRKTK